MAPRNKENNGRTVKRKMKDGEHGDSGNEDDYRKRRDRNNQVIVNTVQFIQLIWVQFKIEK